MVKMVRAKLTGTWEGGGVEGEKTYKKNSLLSGARSLRYLTLRSTFAK